jgi:hypothetical protein
LFVLLIAPNDGGGQWGPRYLLFSYVPLIPLMADGLAWLRSSRAGLVAAAAVVAISVLIQRDAYRTLQGAKRTYGHILEFVREEVPSGGVALTDLWWLDQVAAAATTDRTILYSPSRDWPVILAQLDTAGVAQATAIRSETESPDMAVPVTGTCYVESGRRAIEPRSLVAMTLHLKSPCNAP